MDLKQFKEEHPEDYTMLSEQIKVVAEHEAGKSQKEKYEKTEKDLKDSQDENKRLKEDNQKQALELDKYKDAEKIIKKKEFIANGLVERKISDKVSDKFKEILEVETDEEKIKTLMDEKAESLKQTEGLIDNPPKLKDKDKEIKISTKEERKERFLR